MKLEKAWRWFGHNDAVTLDHLVQMGIEGVVTALHHIPTGQVWPKDEILALKSQIESKGMRWSVVESVPVSEAIKTAGADRDKHIENYRQTLRNLGECGIDTVCYNFMPVLDWCRTILDYPQPGGGIGLCFDYPTFVAFDVFILKRPGAADDYTPEDLAQAEKVFARMTPDEARTLSYNIIVVTQGFINGVIDGSVTDPEKLFLEYIARYKDIGRDTYRENLKYFIDRLVPVCEEYNVNLCIHPDDPPYPILGMPRIMGCADDMEWLEKANHSLRNGITFCTGSLSGRHDNDLPDMAARFGERIHFAHLRNTRYTGYKSFYESGHLYGNLDMPAIVEALMREQRRRVAEGRKDVRIPVRPDHGIRILNDLDADRYNIGYPLNGRMRGIAELDGLMVGIDRMLSRDNS
ncbi:MAG: mannonate dehydratase [Bacteroidaceae bacterium]|nr:mannonate dehydratase [Bacteroidaceae bacterium]